MKRILLPDVFFKTSTYSKKILLLFKTIFSDLSKQLCKLLKKK